MGDEQPSTNAWCQVLGISSPDLARVASHREANTYARLIVALLERGEPLTLGEVAQRFADVGIASRESALRSLQRCRPARPPVYRDGDTYALDPHDDELGLWIFRLGLKAARVPALRVVRPPPPPRPGDDVPLSEAELDEAFTDQSLGAWSVKRLAVAILDAHGGRARTPEAMVAYLGQRTPYHPLRAQAPWLGRRGSPIDAGDDGRWRLAEGIDEELRTVRRAVRDLVEKNRRRAASRPDPAVMVGYQKTAERHRRAKAQELAALRRAILVGFPTGEPRVAVLLDVRERTLETFFEDELGALRERAAGYDVLAAVDVRPLLRALGIDAEGKRLAELGPPQKSITLGGHTTKITTATLVKSSCGIAQPFGDPKKLQAYLRDDGRGKLRRRLEADAKSLWALYSYGRLHGAVRFRRHDIDEMIPAPWGHPVEPRLFTLKRAALDADRSLEVVVGHRPSWTDPWSRAQRATVVPDARGWQLCLVDDQGLEIFDDDVQRARLAR